MNIFLLKHLCGFEISLLISLATFPCLSTIICAIKYSANISCPLKLVRQSLPEMNFQNPSAPDGKPTHKLCTLHVHDTNGKFSLSLNRILNY